MTRPGDAADDPDLADCGGAPDAEEAALFRRVRALFEDAVERDEAEWPGLLDAVSADERALLAKLLAADRRSESLLDRSPDELAADLIPPGEPVPERIGSYRIVRWLGRGGMGQVLLARADDGACDEEVAIKLVRRGMDSEDVLRRFRAERRILAALSHPNIAELLDVGIADDGRPYFVMEFVPGSPITSYCEAHGVSVEGRVRLFATVCSAVEHAHGRGIVHRDLKPRNIIVNETGSPGGTVKLLDFGIAKVLDPDVLDLTAARTNTGSRMMSPEYASPEQMRGGPIGPASDVYSLGVVLYELLTGRRPLDLRGTAPADAERLLSNAPPVSFDGNREVPAALQSIVRMALRKEPERRYASAGDLCADVQRFLRGQTVHARADSIRYRVGKYVRRRTAGLALLVAMTAVVTGVAGFLMVRHGSPSTAVAAGPAGGLAIAVLPFDYTGPEGQEYFANGLADVVNAHLSGLPGLTVVAAGRDRGEGGPDRTPREMGAELGVAYVVNGTAKYERPTEPSGRVVVTPRLIRVADGATVWTRTFDHTMVQFFSLQAAVSREIAESLRAEASDAQWAERGAVVTADLEAYRFYLRGNDFLRFGEDEERLRLAEASYTEAVARDSTFAEAWAKLSATHTQLWFHRFDPSDERLARANEAAQRAMRLRADIPDSYFALGLYLYYGKGDLRQAQRYLERALELQPNHIRSLFSLAAVLRRQGRMDEALAHFEQLTVLDPQDARHAFSAAFTQQLLRNYAQSERLYATLVQRAPDLPVLHASRALMRLARTGSIDEARSVLAQGAGASVDNDFSRSVGVDLDLMSGRYRGVLQRTSGWTMDVLDSQTWYIPVSWVRAVAWRALGEPDSARVELQIARRLLEERLDTHPDDARAHGALGRVYAALGRDAEAIESARRAVELMPRSRDAVLAPFRMQDLAAVYVMTGRNEDALSTLDSLLSIPGTFSVQHLRADPLWAPLRGHPRFPAGR